MQNRDGDLRLTIAADGLPWQEFALGESIAVNGVCLTAVEFQRSRASLPTCRAKLCRVTALANLATGSKVNVEPSVSLGERLGGHLVSGHVDCVRAGKDSRGQTRARLDSSWNTRPNTADLLRRKVPSV